MAGASSVIPEVVGNVFDSSLELPTSGDPRHNAILRITLRYRLRFADSKNRVPGVIVDIENSARAKDGTGFAHYIEDWDGPSRTAFTKLMWVSERIWTFKFMLITPKTYREFDFAHSVPGQFVRPNVMCALRMEPDGGNPHINVTAVRVSGPTTFRSSTSHVPPHDMLLEEGDPRLPVLGHEMGHALGMPHIKAMLGDAACKLDDNAPRCYGETAQEMANIMGTGRDLWPLNAEPWLDRIAVHTGAKKDTWKATVDMTTPPQIVKK
jgi:hypothetical protein